MIKALLQLFSRNDSDVLLIVFRRRKNEKQEIEKLQKICNALSPNGGIPCSTYIEVINFYDDHE